MLSTSSLNFFPVFSQVQMPCPFFGKPRVCLLNESKNYWRGNVFTLLQSSPNLLQSINICLLISRSCLPLHVGLLPHHMNAAGKRHQVGGTRDTQARRTTASSGLQHLSCLLVARNVIHYKVTQQKHQAETIPMTSQPRNAKGLPYHHPLPQVLAVTCS